jgi:hypothetical protein
MLDIWQWELQQDGWEIVYDTALLFAWYLVAEVQGSTTTASWRNVKVYHD